MTKTIDFTYKTVKEAIEELGIGKPFYLIVAKDEQTGINTRYPFSYRFTKDKDFFYMTSEPNLVNDSHSYRIDPDSIFGYEVEI